MEQKTCDATNSTPTLNPKAQKAKEKADKAQRAKELKATKKAERAARVSHPGIHYPHARFGTVLVWLLVGMLIFGFIAATAGDLYLGYQADLAYEERQADDQDRAVDYNNVSAHLSDPLATIGVGLLLYGIIATLVSLSYHKDKIQVHENTHKTKVALFKAYTSSWNIIIPLIASAGLFLFKWYDHLTYLVGLIGSR